MCNWLHQTESIAFLSSEQTVVSMGKARVCNAMEKCGNGTTKHRNEIVLSQRWKSPGGKTSI